MTKVISKIENAKKINLLGLNIDRISKQELLQSVTDLVRTKQKSYIVTPYSEFFLYSQKDVEFKNAINNANLSIPDGVSISLALKYLKMKGVFWSLMVCGWNLVFNKSFFKNEAIEKLSGSDIIYDISDLAAKNSFRVFFLGGFDFGRGHTGQLAAKKLQSLYPGLEVAGLYSGSAKRDEEDKIVELINSAKTDILFIAYGPVSQEKWIARNYQKLNPCVSFCLGGTFDFVSGEKQRVPKFISNFGLEWFFRPLISERGNPVMIVKRINRAWFGVAKYLAFLVRYKYKMFKQK